MARFDKGDNVLVKIGKPTLGKILRRCHLDNRFLWVEIPGEKPVRAREDELGKVDKATHNR
jgi:hypothetical protein